MIIGIGCDIVEIARLQKHQTKIADRILSDKEKAIYNQLQTKRQLDFLAGRFAAKEAIFKANNDYKIMSMIEIVEEGGKPVCIMPDCKVHISISHEHAYVIAYAICEK